MIKGLQNKGLTDDILCDMIRSISYEEKQKLQKHLKNNLYSFDDINNELLLNVVYSVPEYSYYRDLRVLILDFNNDDRSNSDMILTPFMLGLVDEYPEDGRTRYINKEGEKFFVEPDDIFPGSIDYSRNNPPVYCKVKIGYMNTKLPSILYHYASTGRDLEYESEVRDVILMGNSIYRENLIIHFLKKARENVLNIIKYNNYFTNKVFLANIESYGDLYRSFPELAEIYQEQNMNNILKRLKNAYISNKEKNNVSILEDLKRQLEE